MKIGTFKIFLIISIFPIYGCGTGLGEWTISELYAQKIAGTPKILYKYNAWGGFDSNANGFIILDSAENFKIDLQNELPIYNLSDIPNKSRIDGVMHECYNSCGDEYYKSRPVFEPMKTNKSVSNEINIITRIYQYRGFSEKDHGLERYVFEEFKETKDSLFFYNLDDVESKDGIHLDELKIKKGEIYLKQDTKYEVTKIIAIEVKLNQQTNAIENLRTIFLTPTNKLMNDELSERGIFREIKIPKE